MYTLIFADPVLFLSTLSLRRATRLGLLGWLRTLISIHALLAESDGAISQLQCIPGDFYPRSPCGERLWPGLLARPFFIISIHALLAESDVDSLTDDVSTGGFLSTLSLRRATQRFKTQMGEFLFLSTLSLRRATLGRGEAV